MPRPGQRWYMVTLNTRGTWLHGDPRGFHSRGHRIHSGGDYRSPPPESEHHHLHQYHQHRLKRRIFLAKRLWPTVGQTLVDKFDAMSVRVLAICVDDHHAQALVELFVDLAAARKVVGRAKQAASHAIRKQCPGKVWADGCDLDPIQGREHHRNACHYILRHGERGAWTWSFRQVGSNASRFQGT